MPSAPGPANRATHLHFVKSALLLPLRLANRHRWLTSALIIVAALTYLVLSAFYFPTPLSHDDVPAPDAASVSPRQ